MEDDGSARSYRYADLARAFVADLPESDEHRALLWMPNFVVARDK
jgi:octaprenyl-diphosphate synthase